MAKAKSVKAAKAGKKEVEVLKKQAAAKKKVEVCGCDF